MTAKVEYINGETYVTFPRAEEGERAASYIRRNKTPITVTMTDSLGTTVVEELTITPNLRIWRIVSNPETVGNGEYTLTKSELEQLITSARIDRQRQERFRVFLKEDGLPEDGIAIVRDEYGNITQKCYYRPDSGGYPTLVLVTDADGNSID